MFDFAWSWTPADHIAAHREIVKYAASGPALRFIRLGLWVGGGMVLLVILVDMSRGSTGLWAALLPWLMIIGLWITLLVFWLPRSTAKRLATQDPSLRGTIHHIVAEDGFTMQTDTSLIRYSWVHFSKVVETPAFFLFFHTPNSAYYTPRRAVPEASLPGLRALLVAALGTRAKLLGAPPLSVTAGP